MDSKAALILENKKEFLKYLKSKFPLFHDSNVFFRDLHYGVMSYLEMHRVRYRYSEAEELTHKVIEALEQENILRRIDKLTWMLNYPEFKKPSSKPAPPAKPAASAAAKPGVPKPAAAKPVVQPAPQSVVKETAAAGEGENKEESEKK